MHTHTHKFFHKDLILLMSKVNKLVFYFFGQNKCIKRQSFFKVIIVLVWGELNRMNASRPDLVQLELFSLLLCSLCPQIWISFLILPHCLHCHFTNDEIWSVYSNIITNIWSICGSCYSNNVSTDTMARPPVCSLNKVDMSPSVCVCMCLVCFCPSGLWKNSPQSDQRFLHHRL